MNVRPPKRVIDRSFKVRAPLEVAWKQLGEIERRPSWAKHIRSAVKSPPGPLSRDTRARLKLSDGVRTTFQMVGFEALRHWKWAGPFLGSQIFYDHLFSQDEPGQTSIRFAVDSRGRGPGALFHGIFAKIYRKNLDRAVPALIQEIEAAAGRSS